ncbi:hypothetical protein SDC9_163928 [bioreactor metagenome]|uniref:Uncharacterized protein n=1 Tax=bioreactor metagenome TaxID=1076179 RepID=A0A645FXE6_9ZZZZ
MPCVPHSKQQCRYQRHDHHGHGPLKVNAVTDMGPFCRYHVGYKQKGLEGIESGVQKAQFPTFAESGFYIIY